MVAPVIVVQVEVAWNGDRRTDSTGGRAVFRAVLALLAIVLGACSAADPPRSPAQNGSPPASRIAAALEPIRAAHRLPALAAIVVHADGRSETGAVGVRRLGAGVRVTADDAWHLGSNTKAFAATLTARLVEQGRADWSTTVQQALGGRFEVHPDYQNATLEQLLAHAGGAPHDFGPRPFLDRFRAPAPSPRAARLALVARLLKTPPLYAPGTRHEYSNAGFVVAAAMVEELTGEAWEDLLAAEVLQPLGITTTRIGAPGQPNATGQPWGHRKGFFGLVPVSPGPDADNIAAVAPSGGLSMSLGDYGRFLAAHLRGESGESPLLGAESFRRLHDDTGQRDYGLGWGVRHEAEWGAVLVHSGSNGRWLHLVWASLDRGVAVAVAANSAPEASEPACRKAIAALRSR